MRSPFGGRFNLRGRLSRWLSGDDLVVRKNGFLRGRAAVDGDALSGGVTVRPPDKTSLILPQISF